MGVVRTTDIAEVLGAAESEQGKLHSPAVPGPEFVVHCHHLNMSKVNTLSSAAAVADYTLGEEAVQHEPLGERLGCTGNGNWSQHFLEGSHRQKCLTPEGYHKCFADDGEEAHLNHMYLAPKAELVVVAWCP